MPEVVVIGAGMAGAIAALSAKNAGASVQVIRRALGATAISSGAIDVAADPATSAGDIAAQGMPFEEAARKVARARPDHPYAVLEPKLSRLSEALKFAAGHLPGLLSNPTGKNVWLPTPLGTVKPTAMAQLSQFGADLAALPNRVGVVQFAQISHFDGRLVAAGLEAAARRSGRKLEVRLITSHLFGQLEDVHRSPFQLAEAFEAPDRLRKLAEELRRSIPDGVGALLLPSLMGGRSLDIASRLGEMISGIPCFEILAGSNSVPGLRLQAALDAALRREQIVVTQDDASAGTGPGELSLRSGGQIRSTGTVLATGRFIGGGISRHGVFRETVFGLPVFAARQELRGQYLGHFQGEKFTDGQEVFRAGIRIDRELRALGPTGRPVSNNLFAAGSVIGGYDPASDKTGLGVAILTGYLSGEAAARVGRE